MELAEFLQLVEGGEEIKLAEMILRLKDELESLPAIRSDFDYQLSPSEKVVVEQRLSLQKKVLKLYSFKDLARKIKDIKRVFEVECRTLDIPLEDGADSMNPLEKEQGELRKLNSQQIYNQLKECNFDDRKVIERLLDPTLDLKEIETPNEPESKPAPARKRKKNIKLSTLKVDEGIDMLGKGTTPSKVFKGWSKARITAYQQIDKKPNAYYYRFNTPGEKQGSGAWSDYEKDCFFKRLAEVGANGQWGIFAIKVPGRVGYQCANFYRHLIKTGQIVDTNYEKDNDGNIHFIGSRQANPVAEAIDALDSQTIRPLRNDISNKKKRKRKQNENDEFVFYSKIHQPPDINPLPGFIDVITMEQVVKPAISPSGHVLGYDTWLRCLANDKVCPLTKLPLSKRDLITLTFDNIDNLRPLIKE